MTVLGVGLDIVAVHRVTALLARHGERFLSRCFADGEVRRRDGEHVAGLVAAKEACFKALGTGWGEGVGWRDVVVEATAAGAPVLRLAGGAARRAALLGVTRQHVAISHDGGLAVAVVVLEGVAPARPQGGGGG